MLSHCRSRSICYAMLVSLIFFVKPQWKLNPTEKNVKASRSLLLDSQPSHNSKAIQCLLIIRIDGVLNDSWPKFDHINCTICGSPEVFLTEVKKFSIQIFFDVFVTWLLADAWTYTRIFFFEKVFGSIPISYWLQVRIWWWNSMKIEGITKLW